MNLTFLNTKFSFAFIWLIILALNLSACTAQLPPPTPPPTTIVQAVTATPTEPSPTASPTIASSKTSTTSPTPQPTNTLSPTPVPPTVTPIPPTETPTATITPGPTDTTSLTATETNSPTATETIIPTSTFIPVETPALSSLTEADCDDIDANWGSDWAMTIAALDFLIENEQSCGAEPLPSKKYAAHFSYGFVLEDQGDFEGASAQFEAALLLDPYRREAIEALQSLGALPAPTPAACLSDSPPLPDPSPPTPPDPSQFVTAVGNQLQLNGQPFQIKGVNYYPRHAPWYDFIEKSDLAEMATELDLISQAGFNTIRVFLRYEPLFTCKPEDAIPNEAMFAKIDALFQLARERNLQMIVTLNDLPDLAFRPIYTDWPHHNNRTIYIVRRYRNEPHILAWDLRNEGDLDYGIRPNDTPLAQPEDVISWLAHISEVVRAQDPHHLLTAGWWGDPSITAPYVDLLSFHHWAGAENLRSRVAAYVAKNDKPLLLQEVGYSSQTNEASQAQILGQVIEAADTAPISGWVVWTDFDYVPPPGRPPNFEHFFGLWHTDLTEKPALGVLPLD